MQPPACPGPSCEELFVMGAPDVRVILAKLPIHRRDQHLWRDRVHVCSATIWMRHQRQSG